MSDGAKSYRDLSAWQEAILLAEQVYRFAALLPETERFGLSSQLRRAAVTVPSNIAEGYGRGPSAAYAQFLKVARGSLREVEMQLNLSARLGLIDQGGAEGPLRQCDKVGKLLHGLLRSVETA